MIAIILGFAFVIAILCFIIAMYISDRKHLKHS